MGMCQNKHQLKTVVIYCPICEQTFNTESQKPFQICTSKHLVCSRCLNSMKNHSRLKNRQFLECPFCKQPCTDDLLKINSGIYQFIDRQIDILDKLPDNRKQLYAFSSVYLPVLHKVMKEEAQNQGKTPDKKIPTVQAIEIIRIKGKMMEEYQVFDLEMFNCCYNLKKLFITKNQIKALETRSFTHDKLLILELSKNKIEGLKTLMGDNSSSFKFLRVLNLQNNQIGQIQGISHLQHLQVLNLNSNKIKKIEDLQGLTSLLYLSLEHNQITQIIQLPFLASLRAFRLFGNKITPQMWAKFSCFNLPELRLLTFTVLANTYDKYSCHSFLRKARMQNLLLLIGQMLQDEAENITQIDEKGLQVNKVNLIQINSSSKAFYIDEDTGRNSFISKAILKAINHDKIGEYINFKPVADNLFYEVNQFGNSITKIGQSADPNDYLYLKVNTAQSTASSENINSKFIKFTSTTNKITLGICPNRANDPLSVQIDLEASIFQKQSLAHPIIGLKQAIDIKTPFQCILKVNFVDNKVQLIVNSELVCEIGSVDLSEVSFFVNIKEIGNEIIMTKLHLN